MTYRILDCCRLCEHPVLIPYLDLGEQPLANGLLQTADEPFERYPLALCYCERCRLSQLSVVVEPKLMFTDYRWRSGISKSWQEHCKQLVKDLARMGNFDGATIIDIGSNDGTLLAEFDRRYVNVKTVGVDPSPIDAHLYKNVMIKGMWGQSAAKTIRETEGPASIITATNVLAHIDDLHGFIQAVTYAMADEGIFVVEVPSQASLLINLLFDTVYHEHLSYFGLVQLRWLLAKHGLWIVSVLPIDSQGGSLSVMAIKSDEKVIDPQFIDEIPIDKYHKFQQYVDRHCKNFLNSLGRIRSSEYNVIGVGASAKATVFLNYLGLTQEDLYCVYDDNELKQGLFIPGTGIQVRKTWEGFSKHDALLLLSWNIAEELKAKFRGLGNPVIYRQGGKVVVE